MSPHHAEPDRSEFRGPRAGEIARLAGLTLVSVGLWNAISGLLLDDEQTGSNCCNHGYHNFALFLRPSVICSNWQPSSCTPSYSKTKSTILRSIQMSRRSSVDGKLPLRKLRASVQIRTKLFPNRL